MNNKDYRKCSTCLKALKWLEENHVEFKERAIVTENPTYEELKEWYGESTLIVSKGYERRDTMYPQINKRETGIKLRKIMDERGITVKDVQQYLKLGSVQSVYHWLNGLSMPTVDNLYALSGLFKLPIDAMICGNRRDVEPEVVLEIKSPSDKRVYEYYSKLCEMYAA